jgi:hypothetical protein
MTESDRAAWDLGAVFDAHVKAESVDRDVAAMMATMASEPYLTHVPTLRGGTGRSRWTPEQMNLLALHRVRSRLVGQRAGVINQIRGFLIERGITVRQGMMPLRKPLPDIPSSHKDALSPRMVGFIADLAGAGSMNALRLCRRRSKRWPGKMTAANA